MTIFVKRGGGKLISKILNFDYVQNLKVIVGVCVGGEEVYNVAHMLHLYETPCFLELKVCNF